jgi:hypothetical protein
MEFILLHQTRLQVDLCAAMLTLKPQFFNRRVRLRFGYQDRARRVAEWNLE